ncbi:MAG: hypothetical protein LKF43_10645, partial [Streptococcaceae bacterium]|nr:hypothetical protein [Streptococcaceae bacterium]
STAQHSTAQHSTAQHSTAQHSTAQHSTAQHSTAQHSTAQHSTAHSVALGNFIALELWMRLACFLALQRLETVQEPQQIAGAESKSSLFSVVRSFVSNNWVNAVSKCVRTQTEFANYLRHSTLNFMTIAEALT